MAVRTFAASTSLIGQLNAEPVTNNVSRAPTSAPRRPKMSQEEKHRAGVTFAHQAKLPKLPIPDLGHSLDQFLGALKPLQNAAERHDTENAVQEFLKNEGPELQERLKKYATGKSSYIEQFCKSDLLTPTLNC